MKPYTIHKPTHEWFAPHGAPAIAIGQKRGDTLMINRIDSAGNVCERARAVGTCADHLTGYGDGVALCEALSVESMQGAWRYMFGADIPAPVVCEVTKPC
jgi:hypothetical protein